MTNQEKADLIAYIKAGKSFKEIRRLVKCSDQTIRNYIKAIRSPLSEVEALKKEVKIISEVHPSKDIRLKGWICPKCGSVYSPFVTECERCKNSNYKYTADNRTYEI